jgi:hypothetical protein
MVNIQLGMNLERRNRYQDIQSKYFLFLQE